MLPPNFLILGLNTLTCCNFLWRDVAPNVWPWRGVGPQCVAFQVAFMNATHITFKVGCPGLEEMMHFSSDEHSNLWAPCCPHLESQLRWIDGTNGPCE